MVAEEKDPVIEQFAELRKYVEFSHKDLSKRLDLTATHADVARLERKTDARFEQVDKRFDLVDTRFDRLERKIDALGPARRPRTRRRKP